MNIKRIRAHAMHYLSHEVAASARMSLAELQQFVAGNFHPNREQIEALARRLELIR
jgi:hypothetical protein